MEWWESLAQALKTLHEEQESSPLSQWPTPPPPLSLAITDERCLRCGKPTRYAGPGADGVPTCAACRGQVAQPRPRPRVCPADGADLQVEAVSNVSVDRCPTCAGVWLDGNELELVVKAAGQAARRDSREASDLLATVLAGLPARTRRPRPPAAG
jgi:hypothetical protein